MKRNIIILSSIILLVLSSCGNEKKKETQNPNIQKEQVGTEVTPKVILENDYAIVEKISLAPGDFLPTHKGEKRIIYSLTDYALDWEENDKKLGIKKRKKGDVHVHEKGKHAAKNSGTTTAEWLVFIKKNKDLPECGDNTAENDVNSVSPNFAQTVFDNDDFKITEVILPKGKSIPSHSGINRLLYSLSDYELNYESDNKGKINKQFKINDIHWHEACTHSLSNDGDSNANFLVVSYK